MLYNEVCLHVIIFEVKDLGVFHESLMRTLHLLLGQFAIFFQSFAHQLNILTRDISIFSDVKPFGSCPHLPQVVSLLLLTPDSFFAAARLPGCHTVGSTE